MKTPEQIEERKVNAAKRSVENLAKDIKCALYNNGKTLAKGKAEKLKKCESQIKDLEKLATSSEHLKELTSRISELRKDLPA